MQLLDLPPEVVLSVVKCLDYQSKHNFRLCCKYCKGLVDEPSVWKGVKLKLKTVDTGNKSFWKILKTRHVGYLSLLNCKHLMPKHFEVIFKQLNSSLIWLETQCVLLHMDPRVLVKLSIQNLEQLSIHCGLALVPCEGCNTQNLAKFSSLKSLTFHNVTNTYLQHLSKDLCKVRIPKLQVFKILGTGVPLSKLHINHKLAIGMLQHETLNELCIPEYSQIEDDFYEMYKDGRFHSKDGPNTSTLQLLGSSNIQPLTSMIYCMKHCLTTLFVCIEADTAPKLTDILCDLTQLSTLGIKFESVPKEPNYYLLDRLPQHLENLSLAFELSISPVAPPLGLKLLRSGSKWFPHCLMSCLPKPLRPKLKVLWVGTVLLKTQDVDVLLEDFANLETLTCRFAEEVPSGYLIQLSQLPKLNSIYLHGVKQEENVMPYQRKIAEVSKNRLHMYTTMYPLFILPSFTMQEKYHVAKFKPLPRSVLFGHSHILGNGIL